MLGLTEQEVLEYKMLGKMTLAEIVNGQWERYKELIDKNLKAISKTNNTFFKK
jgi:hypothetical protein